jgi:hypothetical protein
MRIRLYADSGRTYDVDEDDFGQFRDGALAPLGRLQPLDGDDIASIADWARNQASSTTNANDSERLRGLSAFVRAAGFIVKVQQLS